MIGPGDVQWMTAASGVVHEELHETQWAKQGGTFQAIQLWVNLPQAQKMSAPRYQTLLDADIPAVALEHGRAACESSQGRFRDRKDRRGRLHRSNYTTFRYKPARESS